MFIDTHTHITWGIDDGIQTLNECIEVLHQCEEDGIERVIATPHFIPGRHDKKTVLKMVNRMQEVQNLCEQHGIKYYPGSEVFLNRDYLDMIDAKLFFTLANSRYLLCEFNVRENIGTMNRVEDRLYELCIRHYTPIVAHVERYFHEGIDIDRVRSWIQMGCKVQVNRTSIMGLHGKVIQKNAMELLENEIVHVVATDTHRTNGSRIAKLSDAYDIIQKRFGEENAQILTYYNPLHIIENEKLEDMKEVVKKKHLFFRKGH